MFDNKVQENYSQEEFEYPSDKIAQVDGNDSIDDVSEYVFDDALVPATTKEPTIVDKTAPFTLNKSKQIQTLASDATRPDFEIEINDNDRNVNILCSTGFYDAVAKPVVCGFSKGTTMNINNISVNCRHIDHNRDSRCYEYNRVLHIDIGSDGQFKIGKVTIHLHHTRRLVQLQGSAKMPDGSKAPVWFLTYFIKDRFTSTAKLKHYDIATLNSAILRAVDKNRIGDEEKSCSLCSRHFTNNSKPTKCLSCPFYFHKTSCLPAHSSTCLKSALSATSTPPPSTQPFGSSSHAPSLPRIPLNPAKRKRADTLSSAVHVSATPDDLNEAVTAFSTPASLPTTTTSVTQISLDGPNSSTPAISAIGSTSMSALNVNAPPFITSGRTPRVPGTASNKRQKPTESSISPETAKVNYLNIELNATKTKIVNLETTLRDRDLTIRVQEEKIKALEQNQVEFINKKHSINDPPSSQHSSHTCSYHHPRTECSPCSRSHLPCHCSHPHYQHTLHQSQTDSGREQLLLLKDIKNLLNSLQDGISMIAANAINNTPADRAGNATKDNVRRGNSIHDDNTEKPEHIEVVSVEIVNDMDDSIASADENVPEIPSVGTPHTSQNLN